MQMIQRGKREYIGKSTGLVSNDPLGYLRRGVPIPIALQQSN